MLLSTLVIVTHYSGEYQNNNGPIVKTISPTMRKAIVPDAHAHTHTAYCSALLRISLRLVVAIK